VQKPLTVKSSCFHFPEKAEWDKNLIYKTPKDLTPAGGGVFCLPRAGSFVFHSSFSTGDEAFVPGWADRVQFLPCFSPQESETLF